MWLLELLYLAEDGRRRKRRHSIFCYRWNHCSAICDIWCPTMKFSHSKLKRTQGEQQPFFFEAFVDQEKQKNEKNRIRTKRLDFFPFYLLTWVLVFYLLDWNNTVSIFGVLIWNVMRWLRFFLWFWQMSFSCLLCI